MGRVMMENLEVKVHDLNRQACDARINDFLTFEKHWTAIGEDAWDAEKFQKVLPGKFDVSVYASLGNELVGYAIGSEGQDAYKLNKIVTHKEVRNRGVGTRLWYEFLKKCKAQGAKRIEFRALVDNAEAKKFYIRKGCVFDGVTRGADERDRHDIYYVINAAQPVAHSKPSIDEGDMRAVQEVMARGELAKGRSVNALVERVGEYIGKKYGVGTNSGANALFIALKALDVGRGSEVIVPSYVCGSVLHAIENTNASAVFVDSARDTPDVALGEVKAKVTPKTKAVIVPHMFGRYARGLEGMRELGIPIVEDCAQAFGAMRDSFPAGYAGDIAVFSLYPTKMLASFSGGLALTNNARLFGRMYDALRTDNREVWGEAFSNELRNVDAALAMSQLGKLEHFIAARKEIAAFYDRHLPEEFERWEPEDGDIPFRYIVRHPDADEILSAVNKRGVHARKPVYAPLHRYKEMSDDLFPNTVAMQKNAISLPIYPALSRKEMQEVVGVLSNWKYEK